MQILVENIKRAHYRKNITAGIKQVLKSFEEGKDRIELAQVGRLFGCCNKPSGSRKSGEFLENLS
jgi:hypothetical protein